jgi:predicted nuclease of predicted toxin-antitoxin system
VRLLIDEALSWRVAEALREAEHDAVHTGDLGLISAPDPVILQRALDEDRVLVSADTDFAMLLATHSASRLSFVLLRPAPDTPAEQAAVLLANLGRLEPALNEGCLAVIEPSRVRIRRLPMDREYDSE